MFALSDNRRDAVRNCAAGLTLPLRRRVPFLGRFARIRVRFGSVRHDFAVRDYSELRVLEAIFLGRQYDLELVADPHVVVDLGSNIGASVVWFRTRFPRARIIAVEPDPTTFESLRMNTSQLTQLDLVNAAVGSFDGTAELRRSGASWSTSLVNGTPTGEQVSVRRLSTILEDLDVDQVDVLKVDIEGSEYELFSDLGSVSPVEVIVAELHPTARADPPDVEALLGGYQLEMVQTGGDELLLARRR
jgi:FkbM family methyltransferase